MTESMFTVEQFNQMKAKLKPASLPVVGIVCRPSVEMAIRTKMMEVKHDPNRFSGLWGIEIFTDSDQARDVIAFTDQKLMRAYLQRRSRPLIWIRCLMRGLFKNDRTRARIYRIPFALPPVTEFTECEVRL